MRKTTSATTPEISKHISESFRPFDSSGDGDAVDGNDAA
jgi:hypothetical protein